MPRRLIYPKEVTDQEARRLAEPAALATVIFCCLMILVGFQKVISGDPQYILIVLGVVGIVYAFVLFYIIMPSPQRLIKYKWLIFFANMSAVSLGVLLLSGYFRIFPLVVMTLISIIMLVLWDRRVTNIFLLSTACVYLLIAVGRIPLADIIYQSGFFLTQNL